MHIPSDEITLDTAKVLVLLVLWMHKSELPVLIGDDLMSALTGQKRYALNLFSDGLNNKGRLKHKPNTSKREQQWRKTY